VLARMDNLVASLLAAVGATALSVTLVPTHACACLHVTRVYTYLPQIAAIIF
jgi:hypothetical protein